MINMSKSKILFLLPTLWSGGTNAALSSLINNFDQNKWDISVFIVAQSGKRILPYQKFVLKKYWFVSAFYGTLSKTSGWEKLQTYFVKIVKTIASSCGIDMEDRVLKQTASKLEKENKYEAVVAFMEDYNTKLGSFFKNPNKIAWLHCDYQRYMKGRRSQEKYYQQYKAIVGVSKQTTESIAQYYPALSSRMRTIYNLIDTRRILEGSAQKIEDERFLTDKFTIISVGRVTEVKRFSQIPAIVRNLKDMGAEFRWYIIGPVHDSSEAQKLEAEILKCKVQDSCIWLGGKNNPYPYFKHANLFVCTSYSEACPMVFNEARLLNLPIVSTDFASSYEFIQNGIDGVITSIDDMSQEICRLIQDKVAYQKLYDNTPNSIIRNDDIMEQVYQLLES